MPLLSLSLQAYIIIGYLCAVSIAASLVTIYDKMQSMRSGKKTRIPESALIFISFIGGSVAMLSVMLIIGHKTKHTKFMIGIPIIIIIQSVIAVYLLVNYAGLDLSYLQLHGG